LFKKLLAKTIIFIISSQSTAFARDRCSDLLRDGVRDEIASGSSLNHSLVRHQQFCTIAKEHNLSTENFQKFAKDYAKK